MEGEGSLLSINSNRLEMGVGGWGRLGAVGPTAQLEGGLVGATSEREECSSQP